MTNNAKYVQHAYANMYKFLNLVAPFAFPHGGDFDVSARQRITLAHDNTFGPVT